MKLFSKLLGKDTELSYVQYDAEKLVNLVKRLIENREKVAKETNAYLLAQSNIELDKIRRQASISKGISYDPTISIELEDNLQKVLREMIGETVLSLLQIMAYGEEKLKKASPHDLIAIELIVSIERMGIPFVETIGNINDTESVFEYLDSIIQENNLTAFKASNEIKEINRQY